jgi:PAS domain S-box-containing protein
VWVIDHATMQRRNDQGQPLLFEGVMIDVTPLREAERKAQEAEDRFQTLVERAPVVLYGYAITAWDPVAIEVDYLGPQIADILGIPPSTWLDNPLAGWFELIHPDDRERVQAGSEHVWRTGNDWRLEYRIIAADGSIRWLADRGTCVDRDEQGRPARFVGAIVDITDRREEALAAGRELTTLRAALAGGPAVTWSEEIDDVGGYARYLYLSPNVIEVLGVSAEELLAEPEHFERLVHPDDAERVMERWTAEHPIGRWEDTYRVIDNAGAVHWFHATGRRATPDGVNPEVWHGVTLDVTRDHTDEVDPAPAVPPAQATT